MPADFVEVMSCANAAEGEHYRSLLEAEGVASFLDGVNANETLSYVGSALGGVRLFVNAADAERAVEVIASAQEPVEGADWYCGECHESVEGGFAVCWSCGKPREEVEQPPIATATVATDDRIVSSEPAIDSNRDDSNPYVAPQVETQGDQTNAPADEIDDEAEAIVRRAWRASILGIVFLPLVMHIYSMILLIQASSRANTFTPSGKRRFYGAFLINLAVAAAVGMIGMAIRFR